MREITPYKTLRFAKSALDNGGRFYNLLTQANDNRINSAELAKAAGVFETDATTILFLEMALLGLPAQEKTEVLSILTPDLKRVYSANQPLALVPSAVEANGRSGKAAIVAGYPRFVENKSQFNGMVLMPISTGKAMVFAAIPIIDRFDVYEVFDAPDRQFPHTIIATLRGTRRLAAERCIRFGGVLKEITFEDKTNKRHSLYLDTLYYTRLEQIPF